jgi:uncharacterized protein
MATQIFVNHAVSNLQSSMAFWRNLGYTFNMNFTDEKAACLVISDTIYAMLLTETFFDTFTKKQRINAHTHAECLIGLSVDSRVAVDALMEKALAAGATEPRDPYDHGFMYGRTFHDLDGHTWEIFWMNNPE